jgi:3-deoxy-D-arabino-heptulosonate 7-phosphate (DAHP) synthase class II
MAAETCRLWLRMNGDPSGTQRNCSIKQAVEAVRRSCAELNRLPLIVTHTEIWQFRGSLAGVAEGRALLLQDDDRAELFD